MRYFRCEKCGSQFVMCNAVAKEFMICGAFTGEIINGVALGCGGNIIEITLEEAMDYE